MEIFLFAVGIVGPYLMLLLAYATVYYGLVSNLRAWTLAVVELDADLPFPCFVHFSVSILSALLICGFCYLIC